jgi:FkbH-like protein
MFEIDQYEQNLHQDQPLRPEALYSPSQKIDKVSLLFWGEHCVECSAPACYQTCDLFQARPDTRCRRFRFGIAKNRQFASVRGYGAEVAFKKWGVLATTGNTSMVSRSLLLLSERFIGVVAVMINAVGPVLTWITKDERWTYPTFGLSRRLCTWLHRRNPRTVKPDAFLIEVYNPGQEVRMQVAMGYMSDGRRDRTTTVQIEPRFVRTVSFPPGYSRHEFEHRLYQSVADGGPTFGISLTPEADTSPRLVFLTADFVKYRDKKVEGVSRPAVKCVVWDLDNTLWDGVLAEGDDVRLRKNVKQLLRTLDERGILLSIASKNTHEIAWQRLEELELAEYFLVPQITWGPKSEGIRNIARKLNIGLDTFAFIDDNPFELSEVASAVPEVTCIDVQKIDDILGDSRFQGSATDDARSRRRYYQEAIQREEKQAEFGEDYYRFLVYCEIRLEVRGYQEQDFDRVAELVQRTNQLNFSGQKYDRSQLREILSDPCLEKYSLHCSDRFGSYGLIGFGLVRQLGEEIEIRDLMLSCRVQGKTIEEAFFSHLLSHHNPANASRLRVNFHETKRNEPARQTLEAGDFQRLDTGQGFFRDVSLDGRRQRETVQVTCSTSAPGASSQETRAPGSMVVG